MPEHKISQRLFAQAQELIPGGVNSPVRACRSVGCDPVFIDRAIGCMVYDADGNGYIDYVGSWGPMILGHRHSVVTQAITDVLERGTSFGAPTDLEVKLAAMVTEAVPSIEMVRMVNSGTEATMSAIRLARGFTGRNRIIKIEGCYHGHADSLLVSAGSGVATFSIPGCPGVPPDLASQTLSVPFNDLAAVKEAFERFGGDIAALILEPVPANMGVILPEDHYLKGLRDVTLENGSLLIFDEVITGFRVGPGGAQELYGVLPDLTCLGKIIGGGLPVGAYGGRREIMERMAPEGDVYQAGTLSGNPIAMAAGLATLNILRQGTVYRELEAKGEMLFSGLAKAARSAGIDVVVNRVGSIGSLFFNGKPVKDFMSVKASNGETFIGFYKRMLEKGIYLAPSPFEAWFVSTAHDEDDILKTIDCAEEFFRSLG